MRGKKDTAFNLLLMTGLCARWRFCKNFMGQRKMFANIKREKRNIVCDLNIKVCAFSILAKL